MAGTLKKVRFKMAWQNYRVGDVITPNATRRDWLVSNGYVEIIDDENVRDRSVNRMTTPPQRRAGGHGR